MIRIFQSVLVFTISLSLFFVLGCTRPDNNSLSVEKHDPVPPRNDVVSDSYPDEPELAAEWRMDESGKPICVFGSEIPAPHVITMNREVWFRPTGAANFIPVGNNYASPRSRDSWFIATGGGNYLMPRGRKAIRSDGTTIWELWPSYTLWGDSYVSDDGRLWTTRPRYPGDAVGPSSIYDENKLLNSIPGGLYGAPVRLGGGRYATPVSIGGSYFLELRDLRKKDATRVPIPISPGHRIHGALLLPPDSLIIVSSKYTNATSIEWVWITMENQDISTGAPQTTRQRLVDDPDWNPFSFRGDIGIGPDGQPYAFVVGHDRGSKPRRVGHLIELNTGSFREVNIAVPRDPIIDTDYGERVTGVRWALDFDRLSIALAAQSSGRQMSYIYFARLTTQNDDLHPIKSIAGTGLRQISRDSDYWTVETDSTVWVYRY